jgi:hypothetical protein
VELDFICKKGNRLCVQFDIRQKLEPVSSSAVVKLPITHKNTAYNSLHRVRINYRRYSLRRNLGRKCRKIVEFMSITHSERDIGNSSIVATAIPRENRKPVLEGNGCLAD